uniref:cysteine proteinase inhibitor A-like n=1 Tax=Erigeron canadensis TaxID=72917 RepID=UPI001CB8BDB7|nr:cysteine proteinase inhibitor A-like [Erigeron canadensis]
MAQNSDHQPQLLVIVMIFGAILLISGGGVSANGDPVNGVGAWDAEKYYLKELGEYAVAAHNLVSQHPLTFQKVITCSHLPELSHKLTIAAADGGVTHTYEAVVCSKPWIQYKKLISFKAL